MKHGISLQIAGASALALALVLAACGQSEPKAPLPAEEPGGTYEPTPVPEETAPEETVSGDDEHAGDEDHDDHDGHAGEAHVHGAAEMSFVREGGTLTVTLFSPMYNLAGFEHAPRDDDERAMLDAVQMTLLDPGVVFEIPASAGCELTTSDYLLEHNEDGGATDLEMTWVFTCSGGGDWRLGVNLFDLYPNLEDIDALVLSGGSQTGTELKPASSALDIPG